MNRIKSSMKFVDGQGRLTGEAVIALQSNNEDINTVTTQKYQAQFQCFVVLPSSQSVTLGRNTGTMTFTASQLVMNPGDVLVLGSSQLLKILPL